MKAPSFAPLLLGLSFILSASNASANTDAINNLHDQKSVCLNVSCEVGELFIYDVATIKSDLAQVFSDDTSKPKSFEPSGGQLVNQDYYNMATLKASFNNDDSKELSNSYMATIDIEAKALLLTVNLII